jgi:hypothetical protein
VSLLDRLRRLFPRRDRLVPVAEFPGLDPAEAAWVRLEEAGIPATVEKEPGYLGGTPKVRIYTEQSHADEAQRLIADLVQ